MNDDFARPLLAGVTATWARDLPSVVVKLDESVFPAPVPVGWESVSGGGGHGSINCYATARPFDEVCDDLERLHGAPERRTADTAFWRTGSDGDVTFADVWRPGCGSAPGFRPDLVPDGSGCIGAFGSFSTPRAPADAPAVEPTGVRRRWWRRR